MEIKAMRILCPSCEKPMRTISTRQISKEFREIYADCKSLTCGARAVMNLTLSHYIRVPEEDHKKLVQAYIANLSDEERLALLSKEPH